MKPQAFPLILAAVLLSGCSALAPILQRMSTKAEGPRYERLKNRHGQINQIVTNRVNADAIEATTTVRNIEVSAMIEETPTAQEIKFAKTIKSETLNLSPHEVAWITNDERSGAMLLVCDVRNNAYCGRMATNDRYNLELADIVPRRICLSTPDDHPDPRRCFENFKMVRKLHPSRRNR